LATGHLPNLLMATETIGDDERVSISSPDPGKQDAFAAFHGHRVVISLLESKSASHPAASGVEHFNIQAYPLKHGHFVFHTHDGAMMAMHVQECTARQLPECAVRCLFLQEFAEQESLFPQASRVLVVRQEVNQFIP